MSTLEKRPHERGLTLVELSIASAVLVIMSIAIIQSLRSLSMTHTSMVSQSKVTSIGERVMSMVELDTSSAMRMLSESSASWDAIARLDFDGRVAPLPGSRMPTPTVAGTFEPDPSGEVQTGNVLGIVRRDGYEVGSIPVGIDTKSVRVDMFRYVVWYLGEGRETGVDLNRWCSTKIARLQDIQAIADPTERGQLATSLYDLGIRFAWDPMEGVPASAFYSISSIGALAPLSAGAKVSADVSETQENIFDMRFCGIAANGSVTVDVPRFAEATASFPHGFEVKRDGDGSGDLVLMRIVVATKGGVARKVTSYESVRQISFREE